MPAHLALYEQRGRQPSVGLRRLWAGVLAAPSAWVLMEMIGYYLAARSCEPGTSGVPLAGPANARITQVVLDLVAIAVASAGLAVSIASWRALPQPSPESRAEVGRARFMAFVGVLASVLFLGGIVLFGISPLLVDVCNQAR